MLCRMTPDKIMNDVLSALKIERESRIEKRDEIREIERMESSRIEEFFCCHQD